MDFDVIVIGSGFGGAITSCRLAQKQKRVLVLERGHKWDRTTAVSRAFKDSPPVNPAPKKRILAIARRHGYTVNSNAQKLRTNRTNACGDYAHPLAWQ